jgi:hypothetical protein
MPSGFLGKLIHPASSQRFDLSQHRSSQIWNGAQKLPWSPQLPSEHALVPRASKPQDSPLNYSPK